MDTIQTNIVICDISGLKMTAKEFSAKLHEKGIRINGGNTSIVRFVTHYWIKKQDIEATLEAVGSI
jgi:threonine aldolase